MQFSDFIAPSDAAKFLAEDFGRRPVHFKRGAVAPLDILSWQRFNEVLALRPYWTPETLKLAIQSRPALVEHYCDTIETASGSIVRASPEKVQAILGLGASLVADQIQWVCPSVHKLSRVLEEEFAARVGANVYCSFKGVQAFNTHFDLHDVFAVQTEGEKLWHVYEARADNPVEGLPDGDETTQFLLTTRGRVLLEAHMKPGDVLYLPRGQYHDAIATTGPSLHVSFSVEPLTGVQLISLLEEAAKRESLLRAFVPDARRGPDIQAHLQSFAARLAAIITGPAFVHDIQNAQHALATPLSHYKLPSNAHPQFYNVLRRAPVARRDHGYVLVAGPGQEISLGRTYPAVEWLLIQRSFSAEDAAARHPYVPRDELSQVIDRLAAAGFIAKTPIN